MAREHSFSIGLPDNIVYCKQFLETLQNKLDGSVHPDLGLDPSLDLDRPRLLLSSPDVWDSSVLLCQSSVFVLRENLPG